MLPGEMAHFMPNTALRRTSDLSSAHIHPNLVCGGIGNMYTVLDYGVQDCQWIGQVGPRKQALLRVVRP